MSSGPVGTKPVKFRKYYHLHLKPEDYCSYDGECHMDTNIGPPLCWACKYAKKLDIPTLLIEKGRDN